MTDRVGAGRYAPSPTGELHLGNLRTAVLAWLFARSTDRELLLRIEDLDAGRVRPGFAEQQVADLTALGLDFDGVPVVQSQRYPAYAAALAVIADRSYECFCTRRDIAEATSAPHGEFARLSRHLSPADRRATSGPAPNPYAGPAASGRRGAADRARPTPRFGDRPGR